MESTLLCTFAHRNNKNLIIDYINKTYDLMGNRIFVFNNKYERDDLYFTYNVFDKCQVSENTILIHRKKEYNVLYTINALNNLIRTINNGVLDTTYQIDWARYRNSLLLTDDSEVSVVSLIIDDIIDNFVN